MYLFLYDFACLDLMRNLLDKADMVLIQSVSRGCGRMSNKSSATLRITTHLAETPEKVVIFFQE